MNEHERMGVNDSDTESASLLSCGKEKHNHSPSQDVLNPFRSIIHRDAGTLSYRSVCDSHTYVSVGSWFTTTLSIRQLCSQKYWPTGVERSVVPASPGP